MEPSPEPPPHNPTNEMSISADLSPDIPSQRIVLRPAFPNPDPIRAVAKDYFPSRKALETYVRQLKEGLQTLVQGPLDYRLASFMHSWNGSKLGVVQTEFETAASLVLATLDAGPYSTSMVTSPLATEEWGTLASACLAAIARGFSRPLTEASRKTYTALWESLEDVPQRKLEEDESPEFHSLFQRLKATTQHLNIHINADEPDGLRKWTSVTRKGVEETARRAALAEADMALHDWKVDQLTIRQQQLEETLNKTILERNVELFRTTARTLGLSIDGPMTAPPSRPTPSTGSKCTVSGSAPQPAQTAKAPSLPSIPDAPPPQTPQLDVITLTAAVQTAMQPFMARLAAIESAATQKDKPGTAAPTSHTDRVQTAVMPHP